VTRAVAAGFRVQLQQMRGNPDWFLALVTAPLMTAVFLAILHSAGRSDLAPYGVVAPALIALWQMALLTAGELISRERDNGSLEALVAAPASFAALLLGGIGAVTAVSLLGFVESWTVGWLFTGSPIPIHHAWLFAATVLVTAGAMTGTASVMSCVFVLARSARSFQNSLSYPFYLLGGVLVPVALLPSWVQVPARAVFLSWSSDLLRDSFRAEPVPGAAGRLVAILLLGAAGFAVGHLLLQRTLRRVRRTGSLTHA
jgi:ABC-2 type transport system permease protein